MDRKVYIVGHKNPDTDSICSAIAYAKLKHKITGSKYVAKRAGQLNEETIYILQKFGVKAPALLTNVQLQVKDLDMVDVAGIGDQMSIRSAWNLMKKSNTKTLPVLRNKKLEGLITVGDIAKSYMSTYDNHELAIARTQYRNIMEVLEATMLSGNKHAYFTGGKVMIAASDENIEKSLMEEGDLVLVGNRYEVQKAAVEKNVSCLIICSLGAVSADIIDKAKAQSITIIVTMHEVFEAARLLNQSVPVKHFMSKGNLTTFRVNDYIEDIKGVMTRKRYRDFPIVDMQGNFFGFISRRCLINARKKQVILVDHNERTQAVDGIEEAEIMEIIDHHRIGSMETISPVYFRNQPLGSTATIVYQMYQENNVEIEKCIAALLCAAIVSDTLMFRSPTCTAIDEATAKHLATLAEIDLEQFANEMFKAGSNFKDKTPEEICVQDFKKFTIEGMSFGVGQVNSMKEEELQEVKKLVTSCLENVANKKKLDIVYLMLTNIIEEKTELLCYGSRAKELMKEAFELPEETEEIVLKGVVSRKKQLLPTFVVALQQ
jgi:Inorganic pyrophosphatase/exopolyphosphatase